MIVVLLHKWALSVHVPPGCASCVVLQCVHQNTNIKAIRVQLQSGTTIHVLSVSHSHYTEQPSDV